MSQFMQLFKSPSPGSPAISKREGRFRRFKRNTTKSATNDLDIGSNLSRKRSVSTSALNQLNDKPIDDTFSGNRRRNSVVLMTSSDNRDEDNTSQESQPKNQISVKELIEQMITHLQVLERKNEILTQTVQQLSEEKSSLETDYSSAKVELNLYKNRLNQIEQIADEWHCSLCLDNKIQVINSKKTIVSTLCGHIFCSLCAQSFSRQSKHCPTCRKPLQQIGQQSYHPIYI